MNPTTAAAEYLAARAAAEAAAEAKAKAEQVLKEAFAKAGINAQIVDGTKVALVNGERANYDTDLLSDLSDQGVIPFETYAKVTDVKVNGTKWKAARTVGLITDEVADKVTTFTAYEQIRVTQV